MTIETEFQAVVLAAGRGSRMLELTAEQPKCLLPVGPKSLLWYPLRKLQDAGFTEALVVVLEQQRADIQSAMERQALAIKLEYVTVAEEAEDWGTADSLRMRELQERLSRDVLVMACDLVSDVDLGGVLRCFRKRDASVAALMLPPQPPHALQSPGPQCKQKPERDLVALDETGRLVLLASASDFESEVGLPLGLLRKHPNLKVHSALTDSHVYVLKRWVLAYLRSQPSFMSLKGELIPYIVKRQLGRGSDIWAHAAEDELQVAARGLSSSQGPADRIRCYAHIAPRSCRGLRVNTLAAYWAANVKLHELWARPLERLSPGAHLQTNQVDERCVVWEGARLNARTSFKGATIGANTTVHSLSRVFDSIVMRHVEVQDRVALEGCIVCDGAQIQSGARLKNCIVGNGHRVAPNADHTNEILTESLMHF